MGLVPSILSSAAIKFCLFLCASSLRELTLSQSSPYLVYAENNQSFLTGQRNRPMFPGSFWKSIPVLSPTPGTRHFGFCILLLYWCTGNRSHPGKAQSSIWLLKAFLRRPKGVSPGHLQWLCCIQSLQSSPPRLDFSVKPLLKVRASKSVFIFPPTLLSFSIFRPQLHPVAYSSRIPNICQIGEMLCGVSSWFLVHKCWRCVHWQKGVWTGSSAAGGGQQAFWLISALFPTY